MLIEARCLASSYFQLLYLRVLTMVSYLDPALYPLVDASLTEKELL